MRTRIVKCVVSLMLYCVCTFSFADPSVAVVFVLDESGSITFANFKLQGDGFRNAIDLAAVDGSFEVGVIGFSTTAHTVHPLVPVDSDTARTIKNALTNNPQERGATHVAKAIDLAAQTLRKSVAPVKVMCMSTDGAPSDRAASLTSAESAKLAGIRIAPIGVGLAANSAAKSYLDSISTNPGVPTPKDYVEFGAMVAEYCLRVAAAQGLRDSISPSRMTIGQQTLPKPGLSLSKKAIVLVHGWNSTARTWSTKMADELCLDLGPPRSYWLERKPNHIAAICGNAEWDIFYVDWRGYALFRGIVLNFAGLPESAYTNAFEIGRFLGEHLTKQAHSYDHVHFIAHSAGSNVIDSAKNWLKEKGHVAKLHMTFLDAYDPKSWRIDIAGELFSGSNYGKGADWVDNYVDTRWVFGGTNNTSVLMRDAYNIDLTEGDSEKNNLPLGTVSHAWPYRFYDESIRRYKEGNRAGLGPDTGYRLTRESRDTKKGLPEISRNKGVLCKYKYTGSEICEKTADLTRGEKRTTTLSYHVSKAADLAIRVAGVVTNSLTGLIRHSLNSAIAACTTSGFAIHVEPTVCWGVELTARALGSNVSGRSNSSGPSAESRAKDTLVAGPAWVEFEVTTTVPVDSVGFDYKFSSGTDGIFSLWINGDKVRDVDQRIINGQVATIGAMYIGDLPAGTHTVGFRLDAYSDIQPSTVEITNIRFGKSSLEPEQVAPPIEIFSRGGGGGGGVFGPWIVIAALASFAFRKTRERGIASSQKR